MLGALSAPAAAEFPATPPNDPDYPVDARCSRGSGQFWMLSTIPSQCAAASDSDNAAGMSVDAVWRRFTTGSPETLISYIEGGVNWRRADARDFVDRTFLNTGELPRPQIAGGADCGAFDCNRDGRVSVSDYAEDARIAQPYINGYLTPEDLVVAFGHCRVSAGTLRECPPGGRFDNDGNGLPNDISGWDFMHHSNDVQTDWTAYSHANTMASRLVAEADNGEGGVGICPDCTVVFIKGGDEVIMEPQRQALATIYSATIGADVAVRESIALGQSSYQRRAFQATLRRGVATSDPSSDFESNSHTEGMLLDDSLPGNALIMQTNPASLVTGFRLRSSITSWGTHSIFSVPSQGGTTSEATPIQGGVLALVSDYGRRRATRPGAPRGTPGGPLSPGEITQLLIASVSPIQDPSLPWPGKPDADWSSYYGYGRPNALRALELIEAGKIPPVADIDSPNWYARVDPVTDRSRGLDVRGSISAQRAGRAGYRLQYALGPEPAEKDFVTFAKGKVEGERRGVLGRLPLSRIPRAFAEKPYVNDGERTTQSPNRYEQYAVTLRLIVDDDRGNRGVDRQAFYAQHDPDRLAGFPLKLGSSGEAQPVIADLDGDGRDEIVVATSDGWVHAYRSDGSELRGWPVHTERSPAIDRYRSVELVRELGVPNDPIIASVAIGDLDRDGRLEVVATTTSARVYVWQADGKRRRGFPVAVTRSPSYPVPSPAINGHSPVTGAGAHPVLADLDGDRRLEIIQTTAEKAVYAIRANGEPQPGWPVTLTYPRDPAPQTLFEGPVIASSPAVGDIDGDGRPEVVIGSQDTLAPAPLGPAQRPLYAIKADGMAAPDGPYLAGWPVLLQDTINGLTGGIDFVAQANSSPLIADVDADGDLDVVASTTFGTPQAFEGSGDLLRSYAAIGQSARGADPVLTFTTSASPAMVGGRLRIVSPGSAIASIAGSLLGVSVPGTSIMESTPIYNYTRGWDATTGTQLEGYPRIQQGLAFFGAPSIADVDGDGSPEALQMTDSFALHAFRLDKPGEAPGYPRFTGGWGVYSPGVGDIDGDGRVDVVVATREGYLDAYRGKGKPGDAQWCAFQGGATHDGRVRKRCETPASSSATKPCLARRSPIGPRNIGRIRLGYSRARLLRVLVRAPRRTSHSLRYCVKRSRGRVTAVFASRSRRARAKLVVTTARGHGNRGVRIGSKAARFRRAYPNRARIGRGLYRARRGSPRLFAIRRGRVRFIAVARRSVTRNRRTLKRHLRLAGLRGY